MTYRRHKGRVNKPPWMLELLLDGKHKTLLEPYGPSCEALETVCTLGLDKLKIIDPKNKLKMKDSTLAEHQSETIPISSIIVRGPYNTRRS